MNKILLIGFYHDNQIQKRHIDLTTTNITTVLTCPADATLLVKSLQASHKAASNVDVDAFYKSLVDQM